MTFQHKNNFIFFGKIGCTNFCKIFGILEKVDTLKIKFFIIDFIFLLQINLNVKCWNQAVRKYYLLQHLSVTHISQIFKCTFHTRFIYKCLVDHFANLIDYIKYEIVFFWKMLKRLWKSFKKFQIFCPYLTLKKWDFFVDFQTLCLSRMMMMCHKCHIILQIHSLYKENQTNWEVYCKSSSTCQQQKIILDSIIRFFITFFLV